MPKEQPHCKNKLLTWEGVLELAATLPGWRVHYESYGAEVYHGGHRYGVSLKPYTAGPRNHKLVKHMLTCDLQDLPLVLASLEDHYDSYVTSAMAHSIGTLRLEGWVP